MAQPEWAHSYVNSIASNTKQIKVTIDIQASVLCKAWLLAELGFSVQRCIHGPPGNPVLSNQIAMRAERTGQVIAVHKFFWFSV